MSVLSAPHPPVPAVSLSPIAVLDSSDISNRKSRPDHLLNPSLLLPSPIPPSLLPPSTSYPPMNLQIPCGTPILQPLLPPTPHTSLLTILNRDKVRDALLLLIQDDRFIDMFYQALVKKQRY